MKRILKKIAVLFVLPAVMLCGSAAGGAEAKSVIESVTERGVLRVGFSTFVPWAMQDGSGGYAGFEIDVARRLAEDLGVELQLVPTNWDGIIPALLANKFDVIIGGMGSTPKRNLTVNFTVPYDYALMDIMANKEKAGHLKTLDDYNKKDVVIAVRNGSSAAAYAKKYLPQATLRVFNEEAPAVQEVLSGRAFAFISSRPLPALEIGKNPDKLFRPFAIDNYKEPIGFAVCKGDFDTLNVFNNWIITQTASGWLKERSDYWFMDTEWQKDFAGK